MGKSLSLIVSIFCFFCPIEVKSKSESTAQNNTIELEQIIIPVVIGNKIRATYAARIDLEVADPSKLEAAHKFKTRMQDSIIEELYVILPLVWDGKKQPNIEVLTKRLEKAVTKKAPADLLSHISIRESNLFDEQDKVRFMEESPTVIMLPQEHAK